MSKNLHILGAMDGLERARVSLDLWHKKAESALEKRSVERLQERNEQNITMMTAYYRAALEDPRS